MNAFWFLLGLSASFIWVLLLFGFSEPSQFMVKLAFLIAALSCLKEAVINLMPSKDQ